MKLAILNSHPIQYFTPLYQELSQKTDIQLKVYYCSRAGLDEQLDPGFGQKIKWDLPLLKGYQYQFVKNISLVPGPGRGFMGIVNPSIIRLLKKDQPDAIIIHGWAYFTYVLTLIYGIFSKTRVFLKTESPLNQELMNRSMTAKFKRYLLKKFIFPNTDAFLYIGNQNKEFYKYLGVPDQKLCFTPYCIDNNRFRKAWERLKDDKANIRKKLGIPQNSVTFIISGKLIPKKRPLDLLNALIKINNPRAYLIFLGDGQLRTEIEEEIKKHSLLNQIKITGFINQTLLPEYYMAADVFVLPSTIGETWGLVTNEAMNFNLPLILSDIPGSAHDLVMEGKNGFIYRCGQINELVEKMKWFINHSDKISEMGKMSANLIKRYSYTEVINGIKKACNV